MKRYIHNHAILAALAVGAMMACSAAGALSDVFIVKGGTPGMVNLPENGNMIETATITDGPVTGSADQVLMLEPGSPNDPKKAGYYISDIVFTTGTGDWMMYSDGGTSLQPIAGHTDVSPAGGLYETGGLQDLSSYFGLANGTIEASSAVPEPSTIISAAMLLLPLGASALRKLRPARRAA